MIPEEVQGFNLDAYDTRSGIWPTIIAEGSYSTDSSTNSVHTDGSDWQDVTDQTIICCGGGGAWTVTGRPAVVQLGPGDKFKPIWPWGA